MPAKRNGYNKAQVTPLAPEDDRRRKLMPWEYDVIRRLYLDGVAIREIARRYEGRCSRRLIQFVIFPDRLAGSNYPGHWKKYAWRGKKWADCIRKHRHHKLAVYKTKGK